MENGPDRRRYFVIIFVVLICAAALLVKFAVQSQQGRSTHEPSEGGDGSEIKIFMEDVSVFDTVGDGSPFLRGAHGFCTDEPEHTNVQKWPNFKSDTPLYGFVNFLRQSDGHNASAHVSFCVDESGGTGQGYDRIYLDADGDHDLTNDKPLKARKQLPDVFSRHLSFCEQVVAFKDYSVDLDFGPEGKHSVEMMPVLEIHKERYKSVNFVATRMRKGRLTIGGKDYDVLLGYAHTIGGRLDQPTTGMQLIGPDDKDRRGGWWASDRLNAMRLIDGQYYSFSATALGDKVFARVYKGDLGEFRVGAGGRELSDANMAGLLRNEDHSVEVGSESGRKRGFPEPASSCSLPVGDYLPAHLNVNYGRLRIGLSNNYHADGKPRGMSDEKVYGIKVRKDTPFVLDFSNKPEVLFASPAKDTRVALGMELKVQAVLIDPKLDVMIRGLDDKTRKTTQEYKGAGGETHSFTKDLSLDPKVIIRRSDGEVVAEGVMPFG